MIDSELLRNLPVIRHIQNNQVRLLADFECTRLGAATDGAGCVRGCRHDCLLYRKAQTCDRKRNRHLHAEARGRYGMIPARERNGHAGINEIATDCGWGPFEDVFAGREHGHRGWSRDRHLHDG